MENASVWKSLFLLLVLLPVVAFFSYWIGHRVGIADAPFDPLRVASHRATGKPHQDPSLNQIRRKGILARLSDPTTAARKADAADEPSVLQVCQASWREVARTDGNELELNLLRRLPLLSADCVKRMIDDKSAPRPRAFVSKCLQKQAELDDQALQRKCAPGLPDFRSYVIWKLGQAEPPAEAPDPATLANQLVGAFENLPNATAEDLDQAVKVADALIERDPNVYQAYKAKLVAMLLKETKFGQPVDPAAYQPIFEKVLSFDTGEGGAEAGPGEQAGELAGMDQDLVHLPFLRLEARGEFGAVERMAQEYIEAYPQSHVGYSYMADAAWQAGEKEQALEIFRKGLAPGTSPEEAQDLFLRTREQDAVARLSGIRLQ